ncbi:MAG: response regulator, partial [Planctomycetota bacterium]
MSTENASLATAATSTAVQRRILVLDDELSLQRLLKVILEGEGYEVLATDDGRIALETVAAQQVDLIIQDLRMPKMDGLTFLRLLKEKRPEVPSIVLTAYGSFETVIEAMRLGAYTHLKKPFDTDEIRQTVARALERIEICKRLPRNATPFLDIIGATPVMCEVSSLIKRIGPTDSTVLLMGESGTGKELVARAIHYASLRVDEPFVAVNCGAFTETLLESELFGHVKG